MSTERPLTDVVATLSNLAAAWTSSGSRVLEGPGSTAEFRSSLAEFHLAMGERLGGLERRIDVITDPLADLRRDHDQPLAP